MTDLYVSPAPPATPYQREIVSIIIDECAEIIDCAAALMAAWRGGSDALGIALQLGREAGDVLVLIELAKTAGLLPDAAINDVADHVASRLLPSSDVAAMMTALILACAAVQKRGTKLLRFGPGEIQPGQPHDNAWRLALEVGRLIATLVAAEREGIIAQANRDQGATSKRRQLARFMQTAPDGAEASPGPGADTATAVHADQI